MSCMKKNLCLKIYECVSCNIPYNCVSIFLWKKNFFSKSQFPSCFSCVYNALKTITVCNFNISSLLWVFFACPRNVPYALTSSYKIINCLKTIDAWGLDFFLIDALGYHLSHLKKSYVWEKYENLTSMWQKCKPYWWN